MPHQVLECVENPDGTCFVLMRKRYNPTNKFLPHRETCADQGCPEHMEHICVVAEKVKLLKAQLSYGLSNMLPRDKTMALGCINTMIEALERLHDAIERQREEEHN